MADNSNNILNQLQQHSLQPPAGAFEKAWERIELQKNAAAPVGEKEKFSQLQEYSLQAPALDFKTVLAGKKDGAKKPPFAIPKYVVRAAAVLLLAAAAAIGIYLSLPHKTATNTNYAKEQPANNKANPATIIGNGSSDSTKETAGTKPAIAASTTLVAKTDNANAGKTNSKKTKALTAKAGYGGSNHFYNNDIFYSLVNYKEYGKEKLFKKTLADKMVVLNKYSYINISDKMAAMLQDVYITKKNGKPSRKAKKTKKKFEKWRKKDEKYLTCLIF
jgi:hypothetical protein